MNDENKVNVIPNWGSLEDILIEEKHNTWSKENINNVNKFNVIYSGTLALKHNPEIIIEAAKNLHKIEFNIIGFGVGVDFIKDNKATLIIYILSQYSHLMFSQKCLQALIF